MVSAASIALRIASSVAWIVATNNGEMAAVHDRMPAILEPSDFDTWLDLDEDKAAASAALNLLRPARDGLLVMTPIGRAVNKVANDGAQVQVPM